jgi:hypothetical protein
VCSVTADRKVRLAGKSWRIGSGQNSMLYLTGTWG